MPQLSSSSIIPVTATAKEDAEQTIRNIHQVFGVDAPPLVATEAPIQSGVHQQNQLNYSYFHPDHLGSSSYITNGGGIVTQHMEYLPFGETLVDEHLNSFNSPFKYNGKEFDEETGNYYYSARYYDPKWSIFVSVDPLAEKTGDAYGYCYQNPINLVDPTGMSANPPTDYYNLAGEHVKHVEDGKSDKKVVLTRSSDETEVNTAIDKGHVISEVTPEEIKKMDEIYKFAATNKTNTEQGFLRGPNGKSSKIVTGVKGGEIGSAEWLEARIDLGNQGPPISDNHLHPNIYDKSGNITAVGEPKPSDGDLAGTFYSEPAIVQGFYGKKINPSSNTVGGEQKLVIIPQINFFTAEGAVLEDGMKYENFKNAMNKISKHKP